MDDALRGDDERKFWMGVREIILLALDLVERYKLSNIERTAEIRRKYRKMVTHCVVSDGTEG